MRSHFQEGLEGKFQRVKASKCEKSLESLVQLLVSLRAELLDPKCQGSEVRQEAGDTGGATLRGSV